LLVEGVGSSTLMIQLAIPSGSRDLK
jgi:hypothetical protein